MNINREFSANANRPSPREVELFFDIEENSLAYIDHNRIKRLIPGEGRDAPSSTVLCRLDLTTTKNVESTMLIVENPLPQDFKFRIGRKGTNGATFMIENGAGTIFADPDKCRVIIDPVTIVDAGGGIKIYEPQINLNSPRSGKDTNVMTLTFGDIKTFPEGNFTTWLQITVFNIQGRKIQKTLKAPIKEQ